MGLVRTYISDSIAKGRDQGGAEDPSVLVPSLSTPSTDAHAQGSGSSVLEDTSHMVRMGRPAGSALLGEEESDDTGVPALEYVGQVFHLQATCVPMHIVK